MVQETVAGEGSPTSIGARLPPAVAVAAEAEAEAAVIRAVEVEVQGRAQVVAEEAHLGLLPILALLILLLQVAGEVVAVFRVQAQGGGQAAEVAEVEVLVAARVEMVREMAVVARMQSTSMVTQGMAAMAATPARAATADKYQQFLEIIIAAAVMAARGTVVVTVKMARTVPLEYLGLITV